MDTDLFACTIHHTNASDSTHITIDNTAFHAPGKEETKTYGPEALRDAAVGACALFRRSHAILYAQKETPTYAWNRKWTPQPSGHL